MRRTTERHSKIIETSGGPIEIVYGSTVKVNNVSATDGMVVNAAKASVEDVTEWFDAPEGVNVDAFINYLMRSRHGSPFEHNLFTFAIDAPIFVWREFMRHRIGFSYNETSGRYRVLNNRFYVPPADRKLVQIGKVGHYQFTEGTGIQYKFLENEMEKQAARQWEAYKGNLQMGIAKEVARMPLGVNLMSQAIVTCNARSLMSFLSLRTEYPSKDEAGDNPWAAYPSKPMHEVAAVAELMEEALKEAMPITAEAFSRHGRVSP